MSRAQASETRGALIDSRLEKRIEALILAPARPMRRPELRILPRQMLCTFYTEDPKGPFKLSEKPYAQTLLFLRWETLTTTGNEACYPMLRNSASGPEIGLPGRISAGS